MSDIDGLLMRAVAGDAVALPQLLLMQYEKLHRYVDSKLSTEVRRVVAAEDVLQQTFADAFMGIRSCRAGSEESFFAWLKSIADHRLLDTVRSMKRKKRGGDFKRAECDAGDSGSVAELIDLLSDHGFTPSRNASREEVKQALTVALATLPDDYRQVIERYYYNGQDVATIARELQRTPGAIRGILDRARKKIQETLGSASKYLSMR